MYRRTCLMLLLLSTLLVTSSGCFLRHHRARGWRACCEPACATYHGGTYAPAYHSEPVGVMPSKLPRGVVVP
ncbi:MAG: hypothetical protein HY289_08820 [Planctomycetes bacterium]|nr:hypothetical protein [Planctomycetota bacterium]